MQFGTIKDVSEEGQIIRNNQQFFYKKFDVLAADGSDDVIKTEIESPNNIPYLAGDRIVLDYVNGDQAQIADYNRTDGLGILVVIFALLIIGVSRLRGLLSLIALSISFIVVIKLMLPLIMAGYNPIAVSILTSMIILPINFYLSHGWQPKTHIALISTVISMGLTAILAQFFIGFTRLSGLASEEVNFLLVENPNLENLRQLILAGVIVGSLGILDDITISQTAVVFELFLANQKLNALELYKRAMNIGQDHISSIVNTLLLVYAGASLPLLLLFNNSAESLMSLINQQLIAEEIVKTLSGSIGLIAAAFISTAIAARFVSTVVLKDAKLNTKLSASIAHHH